jgi:hypothetical protein
MLREKECIWLALQECASSARVHLKHEGLAVFFEAGQEFASDVQRRTTICVAF